MSHRILMTGFLIWMAFWAIFSLTACAPKAPGKDCYLLPDGARCRHKYEAHRGSGATFRGCDNGREYLDPAWWKWLEECK